MALVVSSAGDLRDVGFKSMDLEDPLKEDTATHSSILAWKIPWIEEPGGVQSIRSQRSGD